MRLRALWTLAVGGLLVIGFSVPVTVAGSPTFVVDDDGHASASNCAAATPTYSTIEAAVTAASSGSLIKVCPGNYSGTQVVVDKTLTIMGAQAGHAAQSCLNRPTESRVQASAGGDGSGAFLVKADNGQDRRFPDRQQFRPRDPDGCGDLGLRHRQQPDPQQRDGRVSQRQSRGCRRRSRVFHNCIANNNLSGSGAGNGIYSDQGLRNASIWANGFKHNANSGILLTAFGAPVKNVSAVANISTDDKTFLAAYGAQGLLVEGNHVGNATASFGDAGSAIYIGGGSDVGGNGSNGVSLIGNTINSDHFAGIAIRGSADNVLIRGNNIRNTTRGVDVNSDAVGSSLVEWNVIHNAGDFGIYLRGVTSENEVTDNHVAGSGSFDCRDESSGPGTAGTANDWLRNVGATSSPVGLCHPLTAETTPTF